MRMRQRVRAEPELRGVSLALPVSMAAEIVVNWSDGEISGEFGQQVLSSS